MKKKTQCEGWRRYGGVFTLGPVKWEQCKETATVTALITNPDEKPKGFAACDHCLIEALTTTGMKVAKIKPISQ
jgi:hypothetical protein